MSNGMSERQWELLLADEAAMVAFGARLAAALSTGTVIYLYGDLGAGKTTLVRGMLQSLGHQGAVKSPTYTLVEPYEIGGRNYYHFDLYRLADPEELEYLGIRDYFDAESVCLIEWPEKGRGMLPAADLRIDIRYAGEGRELQIRAFSPCGEAVMAQVENT